MKSSAFAILRTQKLKSLISVNRSLKHSFREQLTPNANPELLAENTHIGSRSAAEALATVKYLLPEKRRKDAVLCIEYLITASPEILNSKSKEEQDLYFYDALEWLKERHGEENVCYAGIHRDETTPHLYAYVVPLERATGRLNAKKWLGGQDSLKSMQSEFAELVGKPHGLQRGIENKRSNHQTLKQFYGALEQQTIKIPRFSSEEVEAQVLKKGFLSNTIESNTMVASRLTQMMNDYYSPIAKLASITLQERQEGKKSKDVIAYLRNCLNALEANFKGLNTIQMEKVINLAQQFKQENKLANEKKMLNKKNRILK